MNTHLIVFLEVFTIFLVVRSSVSTKDGPSYDYSGYTECKSEPEAPLYNGGIINNQPQSISSTYVLPNLPGNTIYSFSSWVKIDSSNATAIKASLTLENDNEMCVGNVVAKSDCWSFLKGGFVLDSPLTNATVYFLDSHGDRINVTLASTSLQPFTHQQWQKDQENSIDKERKRAVTIHVSDVNGTMIKGAKVVVQQSSRDFLFGSAISKTIIGNLPYQKWFLARFNAAVFENELKWAETEPEQGRVNYTIPDLMLDFVRANQITVRGHNIFWEDPIYIPLWVQNLTGDALDSAVKSRIQSLMTHYKNQFVHWDVSNEMLHFDFYEQRLGQNASLEMFEMAHETDPLAMLFMNDFNVVETCADLNSSVAAYVSRMKEIEEGGVTMDGIGLEGHFSTPNPPYIRGALDQLATLQLPIWLTEVDISNTIDLVTQGKYLEVVLREVYSHPSVNGIMLWTAMDPNGCYQMCLTDSNFQNLPAGDVVDRLLLEEWSTGIVNGQSDEDGTFSYNGFLGEYMVNVELENRNFNSTLFISKGDETIHFSIQI
uniref:endo-1,4-beta-xylanase 5-like n=1 Tax=Erigeron canadensis TaxID=72917 RepID=UPI001CB894F8|nr:endo-1,4-beta-xylanase 5-like [Erigeron canadensis]